MFTAAGPEQAHAARTARTLVQASHMPRLFLVLVTAAAFVAGSLGVDSATITEAAAAAGEDLTRLMRGMAAIKGLMAAAVLAAVWWRLGAQVGAGWLSAYGASAGAMASGVVLIWGMAHIGLGALLLHAGLLAACLLLWRDPVIGTRLARMVAARRRALARSE